jgi:hypothetical protein
MSKKYNTENGINFFDELYKSLDSTDEYTEEHSKNNSTFCLISNETLTTNFIQLECGHKFNYLPLFNDIKNHKSKLNQLEGTNTMLSGNEIRCPYCRKKQGNVLPFVEEYGLPKIGGVNWPVTPLPTPPSCHYSYNKCEFSNDALPSCCINYCTKLEENNKYYCYTHKRIILKTLKTEALQKAKEDQKKSKEEQKLKLKEEKLKLKEELKQKVVKSKAQSASYKVEEVEGEEGESLNVIVCTQIIKTGANKGSHCHLAVFNDLMCKRHYNLKNKKE